MHDLQAGMDHACAVLRDGAVRCFGVGAHGRLGTGTEQDVGDQQSDMPPAAIVF